MNYIKVAQTTELTEGKKLKVSVEKKEILLTNIQGSYYAVDNRCPHMGGSLYDGNLEDNLIICPKHGTMFDVTTGKVFQKGKMFFIKVKVNDIQTYPVKVEGNDLLVGIE